MPVSIFGNPIDYAPLLALRERQHFVLIEDAACSIGAAFSGRRVGTWADLSVFSFHPRKFITTGEGGMITTDRADFAAWIDSYRHFGMAAPDATRESVRFERFGTNYKLSNLQAALGVAQMACIDSLLARRRELALRYYERLQGVPGIAVPRTPAGGDHSFQTCCVFVQKRDAVLKRLRSQGIEVQIGTYALHQHPAYRAGPLVIHTGTFPGSTSAADSALALPLFHEMTLDQHDRVVRALISAVL
jgi:dTDP-4-amino-4,6-dideoxygalactose transaminase